MEIFVAWQKAPCELEELAVSARPDATVGDLADALASRAGGGGERENTLRIAPGSMHGIRGAILERGASLLGSGLLSGTTVEVVALEALGAHDTARSGRFLRVSMGEGASSDIPIEASLVSIGSGPESDIRIPHESLEPVHAWLDTDRMQVSAATDTSSIKVDGVTIADTSLGPGARFEVGAVECRITEFHDTYSYCDGSARVPHYPKVQFVPTLQPPQVSIPKFPSPPPPPVFPWVTLFAPLLIAGTMMIVLRSSYALVFAIMMPCLAIATYWAQKMQASRQHKIARALAEENMARMLLDAREFHADERARLEILHPEPGDLWESAVQKGPHLWARHRSAQGFAELRVGRGSAQSSLTLGKPSAAEVPRDVEADLTEYVQAVAELSDVPVTVAMRPGTIGLVGEGHRIFDHLRALLLRVASSYSPRDLTIAVCGSPDFVGALAAVSWLPHTIPLRNSGVSPAARNAQERHAVAHFIEAQRAQCDTRASTPVTAVVFLETPPVPELPTWLSLAERSSETGVLLLWWGKQREEIPGMCTQALVLGAHANEGRDLGPQRALIENTVAGEVRESVLLDQLASSDARRIACAIAPIIDAGEMSEGNETLPDSIRLSQLHGGSGAAMQELIRRKWAQNDARLQCDLSANVGLVRDAVLRFSLKDEGPHALVAGTTGSGKSEFLRTWVYALAVEYSPSLLTFLFIDYKGGAAFQSCVDLPHCVGLVTDLSDALIHRALVSLRAEVKRREQLLATAGASDLEDFRRQKPDVELPALIIVVDEFAALVREAPEGVDELIDIAARGRSLGLHLILATQKPSGVVSERIRANISLRVALRLADEHDSKDVVGVGLAAHIPTHAAGRAVVRRAALPAIEAQIAYSGHLESRAPKVPLLQISSLSAALGEAPQEVTARPTHTGEGTVSDAELIVSESQKLFMEQGRRLPRKPWLEPLPAKLSWQELNPDYRKGLLEGENGAQVATVKVALADAPSRQTQLSVEYHPSIRPRVLLMGPSRTGRASALALFATTATSQGAHVYLLGTSTLVSEAQAKLMRAVVEPHDIDRTLRLLRVLASLVKARKARGFRTDSPRRHEAADQLGSGFPPILLVIESYGSLAESLPMREHGLLNTTISEILRYGQRLGMSVVIGVDRPREIPGQLDSLIESRAVFALASSDDETITGFAQTAGHSKARGLPEGRAVVSGWGLPIETLEAQFVHVDDADEAQLLRQGVSKSERRAEVPSVHNFPQRVTVSQVPRMRTGHWPVGIDWELCAPVDIRARGRFLLVAPEGDSPRPILQAVAHYLSDTHAVVHVTDTDQLPSAAPLSADATVVPVDEFPAWASNLPSAPILLVLALNDWGRAEEMRRDFRAAMSHVSEAGGMTIAVATAGSFSRTNAVIAEVLRDGRGLVLGAKEATVFQVFQQSAKAPQGIDLSVRHRAWLVEGTRTTLVQAVEADRESRNEGTLNPEERNDHT